MKTSINTELEKTILKNLFSSGFIFGVLALWLISLLLIVSIWNFYIRSTFPGLPYITVLDVLVFKVFLSLLRFPRQIKTPLKPLKINTKQKGGTSETNK